MLLLLHPGTRAQWVNSIQLIPANPTANDVVSLAVSATMNTSACWVVTSDITSTGYDHVVTASYCSGSLQALCTRTDTFVLGPLATGTHHVSFSMFAGQAGCTSFVFGDSASGNVQVSGIITGGLPVNFNPLGFPVICEGDSVVLQANVIPNATFQWYFDGTPIPGATGLTYAARDSGYYSLKAYTANDSGTAFPQLIVVHNAPQPVLAQSGHTISTGPSFISYQWYSLQNGTLAGETTSTLEVTQTGDYFVEVENGFDCAGASPPLYVELIDAGLTPPDDQNVCENESVLLTADPADTAHHYQWLLDGIPVGTNSPTLQAVNAGDYKVVVSISLSMDTSAALHIGHYPAPAPTISINGATLTSSPALRYQWYSTQNGLLAGDTNQVLTPTVAGNYYVRVWNEYECTGTSAALAFNSLGISSPAPEAWKIQCRLYANGLDVILGPGFSGHVTLIDLLGNRLHAIETDNGKCHFELTGLASGVYIVKAEHEDGTSHIERVYLQ